MLKKFGMGLALTATFGLLACSDSSSSDDGKVTVHCKVVKEKPLTINSTEGPFSGTITYDLNADGKIVETYEMTNEALAKDECEELQQDEEYGEVTCTGKKIVAVYEETSSEKEFQQFTSMMKTECESMDGKSVKLDEGGDLDLDDEDNKKELGGDDDDGGEFLDNPPSCNFDADADEWGYSYSTGKDVSGTSSATDVEYRIEGKDLVQVTTTEYIGSAMKLACPSMKETDGEYKDEYVSNTMETTCTDEGMITKSTAISYGYMDEWTKEQVVKNIKAGCEAI